MNPDATAATPRPGPDALTRLAFVRTRVVCERTLALLLGTGVHGRDLHTLRLQYPDMLRSMNAWVGGLIGALKLIARVAPVLRL
jgi:hypothetical protein